MKRIIVAISLLVTVGGLFSQSLSVSVTGTINTDCIGQGCFYNGPTILINEVMLSPNSYDGSMIGSSYHTSGGGEWIELYNPHKCDSVDISCYFLGNNAYDNVNQVGNWPGGFVIPPGTVVPPQGFAMIRGYRCAPVPEALLVQNGGNVVEVVIDSRYCFGAGGGRLWFPNAGGWFAFYDANGVPQDAISWCSQTNSCMTCPPCNPMQSDCGYTGELPAYADIPDERKNYITSLNPQNYLGTSFRRIPDGGAWQSTSATPTYATCNDICVDPPVISCNAIAVATPAGGTPPYTYQWDDPMLQTTDTAVGLCAGTYHVAVVDANHDTVVGQVTILDYEPPVSHDSYIHCLSDSSLLLSGLPAGGEYSGTFVDEDLVFYFHDSTAVYPFSYTVTDENGCTSTVDFSVTVNQNYDFFFYDTICQRTPYNNYGFSLDSTQTSVAGDSVLIGNYQTVNQCDSNVTLYLTILPSEVFSHDTLICQDSDFDAFGFAFSANELSVGTHHYQHTFINRFGCDSTENLQLVVAPTYNILVHEDLCRRTQPYVGYNFVLDPDTMELGLHEFVFVGATATGCDSVFTLDVNILPADDVHFYDTICQYETYNNHGFTLDGTLDVTGDYDYVGNFQNQYGCDSTVSLHLAVAGKPSADFLPDPERVFLSDGGVVRFINITDLSGAYNGESYSWHWDFGDGSEESSSELNLSHAYESWGEYLVTLSVESAYGCGSDVSHYVYVEADLVFPNIITPNGDNVNDVFAIKNLNPELPNLLTIYDRWGKKVFEMQNYRTYIKDGILYNAETGFTGENNSDGVYYYTFHYEGLSRGVDYHSSLTIIR